MAKKTTKPTGSANKPPKKGAMAQDPKDKPKGLTRLSPGVYRDPKGNLVTSGGKPLPGRGRDKDKDKDKKPKPKPTPTAPTTPAPPTPEELAEQPLRQGAEAYTDITDQFKEFDPYQMEQKYEMGFTQEMDRARQNVLSQFERRNAEQFGRERQSTQQAIAERGLDPNSPAAQAMVRDLNDREDRARQEAANAAEQAAYGVNEQAFGQAYKTAMSPAEYFQAIQSPYVAGLQGQFASEQEKQRFEYEKQLAEQKFRQAQKLQRSGGGGGGASSADQALANYIMGGYQQQGTQPQQSAGQSFGQGVAQGGMLATINRR
jgi:hypothetical protein